MKNWFGWLFSVVFVYAILHDLCLIAKKLIGILNVADGIVGELREAREEIEKMREQVEALDLPAIDKACESVNNLSESVEELAVRVEHLTDAESSSSDELWGQEVH